MKTRLTLALLVLLGATAFAPAPFPRPSRKSDDGGISLHTFQGLWRVEAFAQSSNTGNHAKRDWHIKFIRVENNQWSFMNSETSANVGYTISIDNGKRLAELDFYNWPRQANETTPRGVGIIRRQGNKVFIIYVFNGPNARATSFENPPNSQWVIWLERVGR